MQMEDQVHEKLSKKAARVKLKQAFSSLSELESTIGKKKFRRKMRKVEKILLGGLPKMKKDKKQLKEPVS